MQSPVRQSALGDGYYASAAALASDLNVSLLGSVAPESAAAAGAVGDWIGQDASYEQVAERIEALAGRMPLRLMGCAGRQDDPLRYRLAANLADRLVARGKTVTLVDANLQRAVWTSDTGRPEGLVDMLLYGCSVESANRPSTRVGLDLVPMGSHAWSGEPIHADEWERVFSALRRTSDLTLLVLPTDLESGALTSIARHLDSIVLAYSLADVAKDDIRQSYLTLWDMDAPILGVVTSAAETEATTPDAVADQPAPQVAVSPPELGPDWSQKFWDPVAEPLELSGDEVEVVVRESTELSALDSNDADAFWSREVERILDLAGGNEPSSGTFYGDAGGAPAPSMGESALPDPLASQPNAAAPSDIGEPELQSPDPGKPAVDEPVEPETGEPAGPEPISAEAASSESGLGWEATFSDVTPAPAAAETPLAEVTEPTAAEPTAAEPTAAEPTAAEPTAAEPTDSSYFEVEPPDSQAFLDPGDDSILSREDMELVGLDPLSHDAPLEVSASPGQPEPEDAITQSASDAWYEQFQSHTSADQPVSPETPAEPTEADDALANHPPFAAGAGEDSEPLPLSPAPFDVEPARLEATPIEPAQPDPISAPLASNEPRSPEGTLDLDRLTAGDPDDYSGDADDFKVEVTDVTPAPDRLDAILGESLTEAPAHAEPTDSAAPSAPAEPTAAAPPIEPITWIEPTEPSDAIESSAGETEPPIHALMDKVLAEDSAPPTHIQHQEMDPDSTAWVGSASAFDEAPAAPPVPPATPQGRSRARLTFLILAGILVGLAALGAWAMRSNLFGNRPATSGGIQVRDSSAPLAGSQNAGLGATTTPTVPPADGLDADSKATPGVDASGVRTAESTAPPARQATPTPPPEPPARSSAPTPASNPAGASTGTRTQSRTASGSSTQAVAAPVDPSQPFAVHVSSFRTQSRAERDLERYRNIGYTGRIIGAHVEDKGTWYRVYVGQYASVDEARQAARDLLADQLTDFARAHRLQ